MAGRQITGAVLAVERLRIRSLHGAAITSRRGNRRRAGSPDARGRGPSAICRRGPRASPRRAQSGRTWLRIVPSPGRTSETTDAISALADTCIAKGLFWLSAWGPDCERVHDIFDEVDVERLEGAAVYDVVMTTWHDDEKLSDVLRFFWYGAFAPSPREGGSTPGHGRGAARLGP